MVGVRTPRTYQAYGSQDDLRPLDEGNGVERGSCLSSTVRSTVHLSATELKFESSELMEARTRQQGLPFFSSPTAGIFGVDPLTGALRADGT